MSTFGIMGIAKGRCSSIILNIMQSLINVECSVDRALSQLNLQLNLMLNEKKDGLLFFMFLVSLVFFLYFLSFFGLVLREKFDFFMACLEKIMSLIFRPPYFNENLGKTINIKFSRQRSTVIEFGDRGLLFVEIEFGCQPYWYDDIFGELSCLEYFE